MSTSCWMNAVQKLRKPLKYKGFGKFYTLEMNTRTTLDCDENWAELVVNKLAMVRGHDRADETKKMSR